MGGDALDQLTGVDDVDPDLDRLTRVGGDEAVLGCYPHDDPSPRGREPGPDGGAPRTGEAPPEPLLASLLEVNCTSFPTPCPAWWLTVRS
ncbi:hypothetical protein GCM10023349_33590 [Nocardioides conyzicola]|uniref:Uncharacterized protein n=1 Tax=Nocardioides conyzicola TaxID=1651781 RepID=A0ABP8XSC2_9ACTN